ncbi:MAG: response regulator [Nitrospinae bacterium]|nr:response regulator [Nitrospinota bacterium]
MAASDSTSDRDPSQRIRREQVRILFHNLYNGWVASPLMAALILLLLWEQVSRPALVTWFLINLLVALLRLVSNVWFKRERADFDCRKWERIFMAGLVASALIWGSAAVVIFPAESVPHQAFLLLIVSGLSAGTTMAFPALLSAPILFMIASTVPLGVRFFLIGDALHSAIGFTAFTFIGLGIATAKNSHALLLNSVKWRFENLDLVADLQAARERQARDIIELRKAKEEAEEATKLKDKFVSLVVHDLKSPLATITGHLYLMLNDKGDPIGGAHEKHLRAVLDRAEGLSTMVEELLDINMLQTGKMLLTRVFLDARMMVQGVVESLEHLAMEKGIALENNIPPGTRIYADHNLAFQVFQNIISNAIKFTTAGDRVTVIVPEGKENTITVRDTGAGIAPNILRDIFRHEIRTTTLGTAGERGTGLGLPLCYDIMQSHGGTLTVESEEGRGSAFFATFPPAAPSILIVDDDEAILAVLAMSLKAMNPRLTIRKAHNGVEALAAIRSAAPDVIISDILMPEMDGMELLETVRKEHITRSTPFIVITNFGDVERRETALRMGANDFIAKPLVAEDYMPRIGRYIR